MPLNKILNAFIAISVLLFSCTNSTTPEVGNATAKKELQNTIRELETKMHASTTVDKTLGKNAVKEYLHYAALYPEDSLSADFLFKGGEIATALQDYPTALHCYEMITSAYPAYTYARESLYLQSYLVDNFLNDDAKAKVIYEQFLAKYSSGNYVNDARAAISNLGKTDEELIKEFEKRNKAQTN